MSRRMVERHDVVVVGGGIAGLAAAWALRDRDVVLVEAQDRVGGRIFNKRRDPNWMITGAHFIGGPNSPMGQLAAELGLETIRAEGEMATVWKDGRLVRGGRFETYPFRIPLSLAGRLSLIRTGIRLRLANIRARRYSDDPIRGLDGFDGAAVTVAGHPGLDAETFDKTLGRMHPEVEAIMRTIVNRVTAESHEMSGHFGAALVGNLWAKKTMDRRTILGGLTELTEAIARRLGNRVMRGAPVEAVVADKDGVTVRAIQGGKEVVIAARYAIVATPAPITRRIVAGLPDDKAAALDAVRYGPYVNMAMLTNETGPMPYDDIYMVGVIDRSFCMLYNTMNPVRRKGAPRAPGGALVVHSGARQAAALLKRTDEEIRDIFLKDVHEIFPETRGIVTETWVQRWELGYPYWPPGRLGLQEALARPFGPIHFSGDYVGYASTGPTSQSSFLAAREVRKKLEAA
ncbi:MAG: flavin monoamine oxidase family protein [Alphaproteobacteria bacterium]